MRLSVGAFILIALPGVFLAGCAHGNGEREFTRVYTPQVPVFLSGPAAVLLTNTTGFSAHATLRGDSAFPAAETVEGELLGRGTKLLFAPRDAGSADKQMRLGGFSFIWDVATGSGFVLSDSLQGFAPVASGLRATNLVIAPGEAGAREATILMNDGGKTAFRIWPGSSQNELPRRIEARGSLPLGLSFSKVRLEPPSLELFNPPPSFTRYATAEALADEIAVRQHNLRRSTREPGISIVPQR